MNESASQGEPHVSVVASAARSRSVAGTRPWFYVIMAVLGLLVVLSGFTSTYVLPMARGTFTGMPIVHLHGLVFFSWILLSIAQPTFIRLGHRELHKRIGVGAAFYAAGMVILGVTVAIASVNRDIALGHGQEAKSFLLIPLSDMVLFPLFVGAAVYHRKNPEAHKRLMLLANVAILPAAFGRFFDLVDISNVFAIVLITDSFLFIGMAYDYFTRGRIHRVYLWGGAALLFVHFGRMFAMTTDTWISISSWIMK